MTKTIPGYVTLTRAVEGTTLRTPTGFSYIAYESGSMIFYIAVQDGVGVTVKETPEEIDELIRQAAKRED